jgi:hypothetical protein
MNLNDYLRDAMGDDDFTDKDFSLLGRNQRSLSLAARRKAETLVLAFLRHEAKSSDTR